MSDIQRPDAAQAACGPCADFIDHLRASHQELLDANSRIAALEREREADRKRIEALKQGLRKDAEDVHYLVGHAEKTEFKDCQHPDCASRRALLSTPEGGQEPCSWCDIFSWGCNRCVAAYEQASVPEGEPVE